MSVIQFPRWRPDLYDVNAVNDVAGDAKNVLLGANAYGPWPSAVNISPALAATCQGAITYLDSSGTYQTVALTATKAYKYVDISTAWTDITRSSGGDYSVPTDERWGLAFYNGFIYATNVNDVLQSIDGTTGTSFAAVSGSPPQARGVVTVGDFLMLFGLADNPNRIQWSGRGNPAFWTAGQRDSDYQDFNDGGQVNGVTNIEAGLIFQEKAIRRFAPVNSRAIFEISKAEEGRGLKSPGGLVTVGATAYFPSEDGFYAKIAGAESDPIGAERTNEWFKENAEYTRLYYISGTADPQGRRIYWLFASSGNVGAGLDYCLCYDRYLKDWTYATDMDSSMLFSGATASQTVEGMNAAIVAQGYTSIEDYPVSFDSKSLSGGAPYLYGFSGSTHKLQQHSGAPRAATLETADFQPVPGKRSYVQGCRLLTDATMATVTLGRKNRPQGSVTFGTAKTQTNNGLCPIRGNVGYARLRMSIAADETWSFAQGVDVMAVEEGELVA